MASTNFATGHALTKKVWEEELFREIQKEAYFTKFMGGADSIVYEKTNLEKMNGDKITFGLIPRIESPAITEGVALEGNETELTAYDYTVTLNSYRQGVRVRSQMAQQRVNFSIADESRAALKVWGSEQIDKLCFDALKASCTRNFYRPVGGAVTTTANPVTAKGALVNTSDSTLNTQLLMFADSWCKTGGDRSQPPIAPVKIKGKNYRVLLVHPDVGYSLRNDTTYAQALREAEVRGSENPIFTGALAIYQGVVIHEHESVPKGTDGGAGAVPYAQCFLLGAQSLCWAWGKRPQIVEEKFDYQEETGWGWRMIAGAGKPKFNSKDFGSVCIYVARTQISDAS